MNSGPRLAVGALGRDVQRAQTIFVMMKTLGFDQIDGVFGAVTRNAVIAFQQGEGLVAGAGLAGQPNRVGEQPRPGARGDEQRGDRQQDGRQAQRDRPAGAARD